MDRNCYEELWKIFESLGDKALALSHYDLVKETKHGTPQLWKEFLTTREVADWVKSEQSIIQNAELNKLVNGISKSHSVGQAQIMSILSKLQEQKSVKDGPVFIYTYIPLSKDQEQAENIVKLDIDPFIK
jgi:hypothetical protein